MRTTRKNLIALATVAVGALVLSASGAFATQNQTQSGGGTGGYNPRCGTDLNFCVRACSPNSGGARGLVACQSNCFIRFNQCVRTGRNWP